MIEKTFGDHVHVMFLILSYFIVLCEKAFSKDYLTEQC